MRDGRGEERPADLGSPDGLVGNPVLAADATTTETCRA